MINKRINKVKLMQRKINVVVSTKILVTRRHIGIFILPYAMEMGNCICLSIFNIN